MKYWLLIAQEAYYDIEDAITYYGDKSGEELKNRFKEQLTHALKYITVHPRSLAVKYRGIRICNLDYFPYQIHYLLEDKKVIVFGVFHEKINPKSWNKRLKI